MKNVLLLIFTIVCGYAQSHQKTTMAQQENLKGKVRQVCITSGEDFITLHFDERGRITKKETRYIVYSHYAYSKSSRLISYEALVLSSNHREPYELKYDKNGFLISDGYTSYENDSRGNCTKEERGYVKIKRIYNNKNQVVEAFTYTDKPELLHVFGVDENGNDFEEDEVIPPSEGVHTLYTYNEHGDVAGRTVKTEVSQVDVITYRYDDKGNWIEKYHTAPYIGFMDEPEGVIHGTKVTRTIEYYE